MKPCALALLLLALAAPARAEIRVVDDAGHEVVLAAPARRIVSLAPHVTETLFAAGAGDRIVATVAHADFPPAARALPRVGDHSLLDLERIVGFAPDLIVVWHQGNAARHVEKVRSLGIPVYHDRPGRLADIPASLARLGKLAGTEARAAAVGQAFRERLQALAARHAQRPPVAVFYQVWPKPLLTVSGEHVISDVIRLCGGRNVFARSDALVPTLDPEAVVAARPEAVVATGAAAEADAAFATWRRLPRFRPTAGGNLVFLATDALGRHSPRILDGAALLCEALEGVRARRP